MMNSAHRTLGESKITNTHSSQDSLSSSRKASRESESIVDTIKDIENRVAYMSDIVNRHTGNNGMDEKIITSAVKANNNVVHDEKWSTLEKKYMFKDQDQQQ